MTRRHKYRRNPEEARRSRLWLTAVAGVTLGGAVGYLIASSRAAQRIAAQTGLDKWRLPDPSYKPHVPDTAEEFELLDEIMCECAEPILDAASDDDSLETVVDEVRLCVAKELHPDFAWPPAIGDHPSATQLWSELAVLCRRTVLEDRCGRVIPTPIPIPLPFGG